MSTAILIPTLNRPNSILRVAQSIIDHTPGGFHIYFLIEDRDEGSKIVLSEMKGPVSWIVNEHAPCYAGAINTGYENTDEEFMFCGADDLSFYPDWLKLTMAKMEDPEIAVVGTFDMCNPYVGQGKHATHYLVRRSYIDEFGGTADNEPGLMMFEGYDHNFTDTEFVGLSKARKKFAPCMEAVVEHLHHGNGKSPYDTTYQRGDASVEADRVTYLARKETWKGLLPEDEQDSVL